jgi:hypothetical protein
MPALTLSRTVEWWAASMFDGVAGCYIPDHAVFSLGCHR